jgi:hypothetical protein
MNQLIEKMAYDLAAKKDAVISKILFEYLGYELDVIAESRKRFPRMIRVIQGDEESYYWNDGTDEGKRIVTFYTDTMRAFDSQNYSFGVHINYY